MREATYVPGRWVAVAAPPAWLLIELPPEHDTVQRCWQLLRAGSGIDDVLDVLVAKGVRAMPAFAIVRLGADERRAVIRGAASVSIMDADAAVSAKLAVAGSSVWLDEPLGEDVQDLVLASNDTPAAEVALPMTAGVTMASTIRIGARVATAPPPEPIVTTRPDPAPITPAAEATPIEAPSYDHLFGATQKPLPLPEPAVEPAPSPAVSEATAGWVTLPPVDVPRSSPPAAPMPSSGLIDSVPWAAEEPPPPSAPAWRPPPVVPPPAPASASAPAVIDDPPDDVSMTISRSRIATSPLEPVVSATTPTVLAVRCPNGHPSPPHATNCRVCAAPTPDDEEAVEIPRPPLGTLRLPSGDVVALDRGVVLGRAPKPTGEGDERPHLVRLASPENDLSRSHVEIVLDGWHVFARDLGSTNGTVVTLPGREPVRLRPHDLQLLEHRAVVTLADEVSVTFEVTG